MNEETKKKWSAMSVWALILSLFGCTSLIGLILAIVDLASGDDSKKHTGSKVAIGLAIIGTIGFIGLIAMSGDSTKTDDTVIQNEAVADTNAEENAAVDDAQEKTEEPAEENSGSEYVMPGGFFEVDGLKITVNECDMDYTDYEDEYGMYAPADGMKYVRVSFTCENSADDDKYVSVYDYECYADGTLCEQTYYFDNDFINANISSGRNVSFSTCYVVPVGATEVELEYTANMWTDEKILIKLQ